MYLKIHVNSVSFIIFKMIILVTFVQNVLNPWFGPKILVGHAESLNLDFTFSLWNIQMYLEMYQL